MSRPAVALACLDLAGTTVKDDGAVEAAFLDALDAVGVGAHDERRPAMLAYVRTTMGTSKIDVFRALLGDRAAQANAAFEVAFGRRLDGGGVEPLPGAVATIETLRAAGIKVALLTGFSAATRDRLLAALGWGDLADLAMCPAEAGRGRPYPDMVLASVLRLAIDDVAHVAVVGDTAADVRSGRAAGARIVAGVLSGSDDATRLLEAGATHVLDTIADLPALLGVG